MKKTLSLALALTMALSLAACGNSGGSSSSAPADASGSSSQANSSTSSSSANTESDLAYVQNKGTLVVGITEFEPMDYQNTDGEWIGFDADLAKEFAESLGVTVEFQLIDWDNKVMELDGKTIDVVWNGMTLTEDVLAAMECSQPYLINQQVVVVPADVAEDYQTEESLADLNFAVEIGSAGCEGGPGQWIQLYRSGRPGDRPAGGCLRHCRRRHHRLPDGRCDDWRGNVGYDLHCVALTSEEYGVGFRKGSDLAATLNEFLSGKYADGSIQTLAETYGVQDALVQE